MPIKLIELIKKSSIALRATGFFCLLISHSLAFSEETINLFESLPLELSSTNLNEKKIKNKIIPKQETLKMNKQLIAQLRTAHTDKIIIKTLGENIIFYKESSSKTKGIISWTGFDIAKKQQAILTIANDHLFGTIMGEGTIIKLQPSSNRFEVDSIKVDPRFELPAGNDALLPPTHPNHLIQLSKSQPETSQEFEAAAPDISAATVENGKTQIDLMILYTPGMSAAHPNGQVVSYIQSLVDNANTGFDNSNINAHYNVVHTAEVNYPDNSTGGTPSSGGDMGVALLELTNNSSVFSDIEALRTQYGADQVTLLRTYVDEACGLAWINSTSSGFASNAYAVVHTGNKTDGSGYYCSDFTLAHEIGHNLGSSHDRDHSNVQGRYPYSYGYNVITDSSNNTGFRTIMSYQCSSGSCSGIPYFSSPDITHNGTAIGVNESDTQNSADNTKSIRLMIDEMSGFRATCDNSAKFLGPILDLLLQ